VYSGIPDVCEQVSDRDCLPHRRCIREERRDGIREREPAVFHEQHHRGGGEHLPERAGLEDGSIGDRHAVLEVGVSISARHGRSVVNDADGHAGHALPAHFVSHGRVDALVERGHSHGGGRSQHAPRGCGS
jgi:hypothetical protein